jgi:hypothetical protein
MTQPHESNPPQIPYRLPGQPGEASPILGRPARMRGGRLAPFLSRQCGYCPRVMEGHMETRWIGEVVTRRRRGGTTTVAALNVAVAANRGENSAAHARVSSTHRIAGRQHTRQEGKNHE